MLTLNLSEAENFVHTQRRKGADVRWEGWDIVFWNRTPHGFTNTKGAFRNGRWGMETRILVDDDGLWRIRNRNVKQSV